MLTKESRKLIDAFQGKAEIREYLQNTDIRLLYQYLRNQSPNEGEVKYSYSEKTFPGEPPWPYLDASAFMAKTLAKKISKYKDVITLTWMTKNNHGFAIDCTLHIYLKDTDEYVPNKGLLVKMLSMLFLLTDRSRTFTIHLAMLDDKKQIRKRQSLQKKSNEQS